jgi:sugar/nucleoside kinase (ribokinase family)
MSLSSDHRGKPPDVVVAGLAVVDVIGRPVRLSAVPRPGSLRYVDSITLTTGGNVSNCGIDMAKLGFKVGVVTRVGSDGLGDFVRGEYRRCGVRTDGLIVDPRRQTSATMVNVDASGERTFFHTRGAMVNFRASDVLKHLPLIRRAKVFLLGYLGLLPESEPQFGRLLAAVRSKTGVRTHLDTGGTPKRNDPLLRSILPHVDFFIPSYEEAAELTGSRTPSGIVRALRGFGASGVVGVKLGAKGSYISWEGNEEHIPAKKVKTVVDATGAGDAYVAGFIAGIVRGYDPFAAARIATVVAASCVTAVGASTAIRPFRTYLRSAHV